MLPLTQNSLIELALNLLFYFVIGSFGAFLKDLYETLTKKNERIRLGEIIIGGGVATFFCYGVRDSWLSGFSLNTTVLITFIVGILGFEIFGNITTIANFKRFLAMIVEFKERFSIVYKAPDDDKTENQKKKNDTDEKK